MIQSLYLVKDDVAASYSVFDICVNDGVASRNFGAYCKKVGSLYKDISLYCNGEFDTVTGQFHPCEPRFIMRGFIDDEV